VTVNEWADAASDNVRNLRRVFSDFYGKKLVVIVKAFNLLQSAYDYHKSRIFESDKTASQFDPVKYKDLMEFYYDHRKEIDQFISKK
jgi:hypothetical protein